MNSSERLLRILDNEFVIHLALSINCNMDFVISSPFLSILDNSFSIETVKVVYWSVVFPKQVSCSLNYFASSFMIK